MKKKRLLIMIALIIFLLLFIADIVCSILNVLKGNRECFSFNLMSCCFVGHTIIQLAMSLETSMMNTTRIQEVTNEKEEAE